jgi:hypothetical protein
MDSTAFHELIAQVRGAAATLAEAEQRVATFKAELAQQDREPNSTPGLLSRFGRPLQNAAAQDGCRLAEHSRLPGLPFIVAPDK